MDSPYTPTHEIAYCMGLIVGEGCFSGSTTHPVLVVGLHVNDPQPLLDLRSVFGGVIYGPYKRNGRHFRRWVLCCWQLQETLPFLDRWLPSSHKREQYQAWRQRYQAYFAELRPISRRRPYVSRETG